MNYTLHQLKVLVKVAEKQSITRAADELHLTQPAVSIQLKKLQEQFDIPLFEVIGRQLYITSFGEEIVASSKKILKEVSDIHSKTLAFKGMLVGQLKISVVSTGKYVMPYFLSDFVQKHKGVQYSMDVTNKLKVVESLEKNEVDFALVSVLPENLKVHQVELMQNKLFLVRKFDENNTNKSIYVKSLNKIPLIFREWGSATRNAMESFITQYGIHHEKSIELTSNEAVKQAVIAGLGYSVMPLIGIKNEILNHELEIIPIKGLPIITHWNLVCLEEKKLSPVAEAFLKFVQEQHETIVQNNFHWYEKF